MQSREVPMSTGASQAGLAQVVEIAPNTITPKEGGNSAVIFEDTHPAADRLSGRAADSIREHREHPA